MATLEELLTTSTNTDDNNIDYYNDEIQFDIDNDLRAISYSSKGAVIGVVGDKNVNRINFRMPRYYNGFDMSEFSIKVNYVNANGDPNYYDVNDGIVEEDKIKFTWLVDSDVTAYIGDVNFAIELYKLIDTDTIAQSFNTTTTSCKVLKGLNANSYITPEQIQDLIAHLQSDLDAYSDIKKKEISNSSMQTVTTGGRRIRPIISFIDDDCRDTVYTTLYPLIKELNIPYALACPAQQIDTNGYLTSSQIKEMMNDGVEISCHFAKQESMGSFTTVDDLTKNLDACMTVYRSLGAQVNSIAYPNGIYVSDYLNTIRKYFKLGMTVTRGINKIPYSSSVMMRVEVFPRANTSGTYPYSFSDVKKYVDMVNANGGWLILMTHCWYTSFDADKLNELVQYIQSNGIDIVGINEAMELTENPVDCGSSTETSKYNADAYTIIDANGELWTNAFHDMGTGYGVENIEIEFSPGSESKPGCMLDGTTGKKTTASDPSYKITQEIDCSGYGAVIVSGWACDGYNIYSFFDENRAYISGYSSTGTYNEAQALSEYIVEIPSNAKYVRIAGYLYKQLPKATLVSKDRYVVYNTNVTPAWNSGYKLSTNGKLLNKKESSFRVSVDVAAEEGDIFEISASSNYNNALYVVYDANNNVVTYLADTTNTVAGTTITDYRVVMPADTAKFKVATNITVQPNGFSVKHLGSINASKYDVTLTRRDQAPDSQVVGEKLNKNSNDITALQTIIASLEQRITKLENPSDTGT